MNGRRWQDRRAVWESDEAVIEEFGRLLNRDSGSTAVTYVRRIRAQLHRYRTAGGTGSLFNIITNVEMLTTLLMCDEALRGPHEKVSRGVVRAIRQAFRKLVTTVPPPEGYTRPQVVAVLDAAWVASSRQRGLRYLIKTGREPELDTRPVPTAHELATTIRALRGIGSVRALLTAEVIRFCYCSGVRIRAALDMSSSDFEWRPDGTLWVDVWDKVLAERRSILIRGVTAERRAGWRSLPPGQSAWHAGAITLTYRGVIDSITRACIESGIPRFTPHRLRHAFATDLGAWGGSQLTSRAGGWKGRKVVNGYMHDSTGRT